MREDLEALLDVELQASPLLELPASGERWRPTFGSTSAKVAVYACATDSVGKSIQKRMAAFRNAFQVTVVVRDMVLLDRATQEFLLNESIKVVVRGEAEARVHDDFARAVVKEGVLLPDDIATPFLRRELKVAREGETPTKGVALERALAFGCSQVPGWEVRNVNFKTSNEELDVLVANNSARAPWNGSAYIPFEAKNWSSSVDRSEYDAFHMKLKERGGASRIGFFVAASGFSSGFYTRAAHQGSDGFSIIPVTLEWLIEHLTGSQTIESVLAQRAERVVLDREWEE